MKTNNVWIKPDEKHMPEPFEHVLLKIEEIGHAVVGEWNDISNTWELVYDDADVSPEFDRDEVCGWMSMPDWFEW